MLVATLAGMDPPVEHWDLGWAQNVDVNIFSLETHCGYLGTGHSPHCNVLDMLPHQGDPGPLQHVHLFTNLVSA